MAILETIKRGLNALSNSFTGMDMSAASGAGNTGLSRGTNYVDAIQQVYSDYKWSNLPDYISFQGEGGPEDFTQNNTGNKATKLTNYNGWYEAPIEPRAGGAFFSLKDSYGKNNYYVYQVDKENKKLIPLDKKEYATMINPRTGQKGMDYIGGTPFEARKKFLTLSGAGERIQNIAQAYGVDPEFIANRIAREGWTDHYIKEYNYALNGKDGQAALLQDLWNRKNDSYNNYGTDILYQMYLDGKLNIRNGQIKQRFDDIAAAKQYRNPTNEKGLQVKSPMLYPEEAIELIASYGEYLNNTYKNKFNNGEYAGIKDYNTLLNAMYNMGEYHKDLKENPEYINRTYGDTPSYFSAYSYGGKLNYLNLMQK